MDVRCELMVIEEDQPNVGLIYRTPIYSGQVISVNYVIRRHIINCLRGHVEVNIQHVPTFGDDKSIGVARLELTRLKAGRNEAIILSVSDIVVEAEFELLKAV